MRRILASCSMGFAEDVFAFTVLGVEARITKLASFASTTSCTPANMVPFNAVSSARPERREYLVLVSTRTLLSG